jgi:hypothetical protein
MSKYYFVVLIMVTNIATLSKREIPSINFGGTRTNVRKG